MLRSIGEGYRAQFVGPRARASEARIRDASRPRAKNPVPGGVARLDERTRIARAGRGKPGEHVGVAGGSFCTTPRKRIVLESDEKMLVFNPGLLFGYHSEPGLAIPEETAPPKELRYAAVPLGDHTAIAPSLRLGSRPQSGSVVKTDG